MVSESLAPVRARYKELIEDKDYLNSVLADGAVVGRAFKILSKHTERLVPVKRKTLILFILLFFAWFF